MFPAAVVAGCFSVRVWLTYSGGSARLGEMRNEYVDKMDDCCVDATELYWRLRSRHDRSIAQAWHELNLSFSTLLRVIFVPAKTGTYWATAARDLARVASSLRAVARSVDDYDEQQRKLWHQETKRRRVQTDGRSSVPVVGIGQQNTM